MEEKAQSSHIVGDTATKEAEVKKSENITKEAAQDADEVPLKEKKPTCDEKIDELNKKISEDKDFTVHVAIQTNDYEIVVERGPSSHPSRRRTLPAKYKDYDDPDVVGDADDEDYKPQIQATTPSGRGRGRPRKYPLTPSKDDTNNPSSQTSESLEKSRGRRRKYQTFSVDELQSETRPHRCDVLDCGQTFISSAALKRHKLKHEDNTEVQVHIKSETGVISDRNFTCNICNKKFSHLGNLKTHRKIHSQEKSFMCDICNQSLSTVESLKRHKMSHLGIKPFTCDVCDEKFASNVGLKEHKARHADTKPYKCDTCGSRFRQVSVYKRHLLTHSDHKPHVCEVCNQTFSQATYLRSHMKKHTGEKPYKCDLCDKRFAHRSDKMRHQRTHTGEKPYACQMCDARFTDASSCRRHIKEHTGHEIFSCDVCGETFKRKISLKSHIARRHSNILGVQTTLGQSSIEQSTLAPAPSKILLVSPSGEEISTLTEVVDQDGQKVLAELEQAGQGGHVVLSEEVPTEATRQMIETIAQDEVQQVAYHILHDDENQQIVEIQYQGEDGIAYTTSTAANIEGSDGSVLIQEVSIDGENHLVEGHPLTIAATSIENNGMISEHEYAQQAMVIEQPVETPPQEVTLETPEVGSEDNVYQVVPESIDDSDSQQLEAPMEEQEVKDVVMKQEVDIAINEMDNHADVPKIEESETSYQAIEQNSLERDDSRSFIDNPDFTSQNYYNWLAMFTDHCKQLQLPLNESMFKDISHVQKTLSDIMAMPKGILAHRDNFRILMSITNDLNAVISQHLICVFEKLDSINS